MANVEHARLFLIGINLVIILAAKTQAFPPQNPVQCSSTGCTLQNSYGAWGDRRDCRVSSVVYPTTEEELRQAVADASKKSLKVKVATIFSHTIPKLACPETGDHNAILISTEKYGSQISIDAANKVVTADSGVPLRALIDRVAEAGLSLVAAPYWEGVTVAGLISTGAHGSSWWGLGGAVHDHVVGIRMIVPGNASDGYAKVVSLGSQDPLFNAALVSVGLLGVISKVSLSVEPAFKRSVTFNFSNDDNIENEVLEHANKYEFGDIQWYPSRKTAVYRYDDRVPMNTSGEGHNDFIGFQSNSILISKSVRSGEKLLENMRNVKGKCTLAGTTLAFKKLTANGFKNNNLMFTGYPVVGRQEKMQTSGSCLYSSSLRIDESCAWDPRINGLSFYESTAIFPAEKFVDFLKDVKKLRDLNPDNFCGVDLYNGILIRFVKASKAYLGPSVDSIVVDFNYYRADDALTPRLNQDVWEEVEQMAFFKHGARPHWAKNRKVAFLDVEKKLPNFGKFVEAKKQLDPQNMFSSDWSDEIVFGKSVEAEKKDGCALEGQCICSEDRHCSPAKGYVCQPGLVYAEARVCRFRSTNDEFTVK